MFYSGHWCAIFTAGAPISWSLLLFSTCYGCFLPGRFIRRGGSTGYWAWVYFLLCWFQTLPAIYCPGTSCPSGRLPSAPAWWNIYRCWDHGCKKWSGEVRRWDLLQYRFSIPYTPRLCLLASSYSWPFTFGGYEKTAVWWFPGIRKKHRQQKRRQIENTFPLSRISYCGSWWWPWCWWRLYWFFPRFLMHRCRIKPTRDSALTRPKPPGISWVFKKCCFTFTRWQRF